jgi:hypothetical protein
MSGDTAGERWRAGAAEMKRRETLADHVATTLSQNERESSMSWFGDSDRFRITTYVPTMVRSLLQHDLARVEWLYVRDPDERGRRVSNPSEFSLSEDPENVEGICATLPLGVLSVKGSPRNRDAHAGIVTTPSDAERVAEAFADGSGGERE